MSTEPGVEGLDAAQTVVLNALIDLFDEETIVLDDESAGHLGRTVDAVTSADDRSGFREEIDRLSGLEHGETAELTSGLVGFVETVTAGLAERGYTVVVSHEYHQDVPPLDAHVYSFVHTGEVERLRALGLDPAVEDALVEGTRLLEDGASDEASSKFAEAVEAAGVEDDAAAALIVAAWGFFRAGNDEAALDHVHRALEFEDSSWAARVVGAAVNRNENDRVRAGERRVGIILRWVSSGDDDTSTSASIGGRSGTGDLVWHDVPHLDGHAFLTRVFPETRLRFTLRGDLPAFPQLEAYYLGLGVYDDSMDYIEAVIERFGSGPQNEGAIERISIER